MAAERISPSARRRGCSRSCGGRTVDPRLALHAATVDKDVADGDAKIAGSAIAVEDETTFNRYRTAAGANAPELGSFHLFRIAVTEMSFLMPAGDHLVIEWWTHASGFRSIDRY